MSYPYTNLHQLNLDWVLKKIKEIESQNLPATYDDQTNTINTAANFATTEDVRAANIIASAAITANNATLAQALISALTATNISTQTLTVAQSLIASEFRTQKITLINEDDPTVISELTQEDLEELNSIESRLLNGDIIPARATADAAGEEFEETYLKLVDAIDTYLAQDDYDWTQTSQGALATKDNIDLEIKGDLSIRGDISMAGGIMAGSIVSDSDITSATGQLQGASLKLASIVPAQTETLTVSDIAKLKDLPTIAELIDIFLPVGTEIANESATFNPNNIYEGTTWVRLDGCFLYSVPADGTIALGQEGGETSHRHVLSAGGYADIHIEGDDDVQIGNIYARNNASAATFTPNRSLQLAIIDEGGTMPARTGVQLGGNTNFSNTLPPYRGTNIWRRTA